MNYVVTARKWRPMVFGDVVGQAHVTTTLRNAIATNRLHHAYVFSGPRGIGKTTTARILAKAINCLHPNNFDPDNECELCTEITEGRSVHVFEIDGASNRGIDEIRSLREAVRYAPAKGKYKVYIIDEVHMLTKEAFNALLKTLEEPPPHVVFVLATTEIHKIPLTILSRCQRFDFRRVTVDEVIGRLKFIAGKENIKIEEEALFIIAHKADGSMRDAQSLFDQVVSFCGMDITAEQIIEALNIVDTEFFFRVTGLITSKDTNGMLTLVEHVMSKGYDFKEFLGGLIEHFRNLLIARSTGSVKFIEASEVFKSRYEKESSSFSEADLLRLIKLAVETETAIKYSQQPRYRLEIALIQMQKMDRSILIDDLIRQLEDLKKNHGSGIPVPRSSGGGSDMFTNPRSLPKTVPAKAQPPIIPKAGSLAEQASLYKAPPKEQPPLSSNLTGFDRNVKPVSISMDEAINIWNLVLKETTQSRVAVWSMLKESKVVGVKDNKVQIACEDEFHLETFSRNKEFLYALAEKLAGAKVRLEAIVDKQQLQAEQRFREADDEDAPDPASPGEHSLLSNPNIQLFIKELDCEIIQ